MLLALRTREGLPIALWKRKSSTMRVSFVVRLASESASKYGCSLAIGFLVIVAVKKRRHVDINAHLVSYDSNRCACFAESDTPHQSMRGDLS
jgi:hypothetical protein